MRILALTATGALAPLLAQVSTAAQARSVDWRRTFPGARSEAVVAGVSEQERIAEAKRFLGPSSVRLGQCVFYRSEADAMKARGREISDCGYDSWRAWIDVVGLSKEPIQCPDLSIALKLGDDMALRSVDQACRITTDLLSGQGNPFTVRLAGHEYEVVWTDIRRYDHVNAAHVGFSLMGRSSIDKESARHMLEYLVGLTGAKFAAVHLRRDPWFLDECAAPPLFFFQRGPIHLPTKAEYRAGPEAGCGNLAPRIGCLAWAGQK